MRILIDYRPALRERTGVGEYADQLVRALARAPDLSVTAFSSSWKDRLPPERLPGVRVVDRRLPVGTLTWLWNHTQLPKVEYLAGGPFDVVHSPHPLLVPTRGAAQVISIHDLDFLKHPEWTRGEMRRDYPRLARAHAHRAHRILASSHATAREIATLLEAPPSKIVVCHLGGPAWRPRTIQPTAENGVILFIGTLEPRKNIGGLLAAYRILVERHANVPPLVLAGRATEHASEWLAAAARPPLAGRVRVVGYVAADTREALYSTAKILVLPSFDEGFGFPAVEAMTVGVPVVASNRGSLPEVVGDAGTLVDPDDHEGLAAALAHVLDDEAFARECAARGFAQAARFTWDATARATRAAYESAVRDVKGS